MKKLILVVIFGFSMLPVCTAQYNVLYNFDSASGIYPQQSSLTLSGKSLFGMTYAGAGSRKMGDVFSIDTNGTGFKRLLVFDSANGASPLGDLTISVNKLFGVAPFGGAANYGLIFSIDTDGSGYKDIHDFTPVNKGVWPFGSLILYRKTLYGMANTGGLHFDGCIFSVDTDGSGYKDLFDFNGANGNAPWGSLILAGPKLYGMTHFGGLHDSGCVFSVDTSGGIYKDLFDFNTATGALPYGSLILVGTKVYGMVSCGGAHGDGGVFSLDTTGSGYSTLLNFNGLNGSSPYGSLRLSGGMLYGMAQMGGANDSGCIFSIDTNGSGYSDLFDFTGSNGRYPLGCLTLSPHSLYGMTCTGGLNRDGVIFKLGGVSLGFNELATNPEDLTLYPNPNNGVFQIQANSQELIANSKIEVYNMLGEKVYSSTLSIQNSKFNIDLSNQAAGVYLYRVINETGTVVGTGKFVIQ